MRRKYAGYIAVGGAGVCSIAATIHYLGILPLWIYSAVVVLLFPVSVIFLYFWWMAGDREGDIPFMGY